VTGSPEIAVSYGSTNVPDGDVRPSAAKGTLLGSTNVGTSISRVFTITNSGKAPLTLGSISFAGAGATQFTVAVPPPRSLAAGRSGSFTISYAPKAAGTHVADLSFANNDANENPFNFRLSGTAIAVSGDDHGDTISTARAIPIPSTTIGMIEKADDLDFFKIVVPSNRTLTLRSTGSTDTYAVLYNANGGYLGEWDDASSTDLNFSFRRSFTAGTYYLEVSGYDSSVTGAYTLSVAP
jgi:hypothetical protein